MKRLKRKKLKKTAKPKRQETAKIKDKKKRGIYKEAEFQTYVIWKSLPALLRGFDQSKLMKLGIEDEVSLEMLDIKTQTEFAKKYGLKGGTCSEWNKKLVDKDLVYVSIERWAKMITPNVMMALAKTAMRTGKAPEVMAWLKVVEGFKEKSEVDASDDLKEILKKVSNLLPE